MARFGRPHGIWPACVYFLVMVAASCQLCSGDGEATAALEPPTATQQPPATQPPPPSTGSPSGSQPSDEGVCYADGTGNCNKGAKLLHPPGPGHLLPLGGHQEAEPDFPEFDTFLPPQTFYRDFVGRATPVVFRQVLEPDTLRGKFNNDSWLGEQCGHLEVTVEEMKKERRGGPARAMLMSEFLAQYNDTEVYLTEEMPEALKREWTVPAMLLCGEFRELVTNVRVWFSSGGTSSVLHRDGAENLHCVVDGYKRFVVMAASEADRIGMDRVDGSFTMDVDRVDTRRFRMSGVPWWNVTVRSGDCMYIPQRWLHQVRSYGSRNIGVNLWWRGGTATTDYQNGECDEVRHRFRCHPAEDSNKGCADGIPASELSMLNEAAFLVRSLSALVDAEGRLRREDFLATLRGVFPSVTDEMASQLYAFLADGEAEAGYVTAERALTLERVNAAAEHMMRLQGLEEPAEDPDAPPDVELDGDGGGGLAGPGTGMD